MPPTRRPQDRRSKVPAKKAPAKAAAPRRAADDFDLDGLVREVDAVEPFAFTHGEHRFELPNPADVDALAAVDAGNDAAANFVLLLEILGEEQEKLLREAGPIPNWKIPHLFDAWYAHYGIDLGKSRA